MNKDAFNTPLTKTKEKKMMFFSPYAYVDHDDSFSFGNSSLNIEAINVEDEKRDLDRKMKSNHSLIVDPRAELKKKLKKKLRLVTPPKVLISEGELVKTDTEVKRWEFISKKDRKALPLVENGENEDILKTDLEIGELSDGIYGKNVNTEGTDSQGLSSADLHNSAYKRKQMFYNRIFQKKLKALAKRDSPNGNGKNSFFSDMSSNDSIKTFVGTPNSQVTSLKCLEYLSSPGYSDSTTVGTLSSLSSGVSPLRLKSDSDTDYEDIDSSPFTSPEISPERTQQQKKQYSTPIIEVNPQEKRKKGKFSIPEDDEFPVPFYNKQISSPHEKSNSPPQQSQSVPIFSPPKEFPNLEKITEKKIPKKESDSPISINDIDSFDFSNGEFEIKSDANQLNVGNVVIGSPRKESNQQEMKKAIQKIKNGNPKMLKKKRRSFYNLFGMINTQNAKREILPKKKEIEENQNESLEENTQTKKKKRRKFFKKFFCFS